MSGDISTSSEMSEMNLRHPKYVLFIWFSFRTQKKLFHELNEIADHLASVNLKRVISSKYYEIKNYVDNIQFEIIQSSGVDLAFFIQEISRI